MGVCIGNKEIINFKSGLTQIGKIYKGATIIWENWQYKTGTLVDKSKGGSYGGNNTSPYYTETVTFDKQTRIVEMSMYTKVVRSDISGRQDGKINAYGIKSDGTQILIGTVTNQWTTSTVASNDTETVFTGVKIEFYLTDTVSRNHECNFNFKITKWYEK